MKIINKSAPSNFVIIDRMEAGIMLLGSEVKAIKAEHADLSGSHIKIVGSEAFMVNAKIFPYKFARVEQYDEARTRKLLLHKREIVALKSRITQGGFTIIPLSLYDKNGYIKLEIGIAKGKKQHEKRAVLKKRVVDREIERELKNRS